MSKIKNILPTIGLVVGLGYGCTAANTAVYTPPIINGTSRSVAEDIKESVGKNFDLVTVDEICHKRINDKCIENDIVVHGHKEIGGVYRPVCGWNIDNVCYAYSTGRTFIQNFTGRETYTETARGEVLNCNLDKDAANQLVEILGLRSLVNEERCQDWKEMIRNNYGGFGHNSRPRKK